MTVIVGVVVVYEELYGNKSVIIFQFMILKRDKKGSFPLIYLISKLLFEFNNDLTESGFVDRFGGVKSARVTIGDLVREWTQVGEEDISVSKDTTVINVGAEPHRGFPVLPRCPLKGITAGAESHFLLTSTNSVVDGNVSVRALMARSNAFLAENLEETDLSEEGVGCGAFEFSDTILEF